MSDERMLIAQAKSGGSNAFGELYERHRSRIYRFAFGILRNRQDAEDAVQRAFQRAFMNLSRFREDSAFSTWMTRIAINESLMLLRQRRANNPLSKADDGDINAARTLDVVDERPNPEQALAKNEVRAAVTEAVSRLRKSLRTVVLLRELQGLTGAETAQRLGLTVSAIKTRALRARRRLREHLKKEHKVGCRGLLLGGPKELTVGLKIPRPCCLGGCTSRPKRRGDNSDRRATAPSSLAWANWRGSAGSITTRISPQKAPRLPRDRSAA
jgi:RNA polymerase sigma-70 factor, ECF subfamily